MSFSARLSQDFVPVEAGARVTVEIEIANRSEVQDQYELTIEGLDPEWIANPVPTFPVEPTETFSQKVHFKPPRQSESLAGDYPFVATVRSLNSGESRSAQGVLQILPYNYLSLEISPKKGRVSPANRREEFEVAVLNMGNVEQTVQLAGTDPDNALTFDPGENPITVGPGQQKSVALAVGPRRSRILGSGQIFAFTVTARGNDSGTVVASAQGQLEQRPLITPGSFIGLLLLAILAVAWAALIPKPPTFKMNVDPPVITLGQSVKVEWSSSNATNVYISANGTSVVLGGHGNGDKTFTPQRPGIWSLEGFSSRDNRESPHQVATITVNEPPKVEDPKVLQFTIDPPKVKVGDPFVIHYKLSPSVTRAVLGPTNEDLNLNLNELELTRLTPNTYEFTIVAENSVGKTDTKKVKVVVFSASKAVIIAFGSAAAEVDSTVGHVALNWQTTNAKRLEIAVGDQVTTLTDTEKMAEGTMDFPISKTTTFTLTVYDDQGLTVKKAVTVKVIPPKQPITPPTDQGGSAGAAGPTTGGAGPHA